MKIQDIVSFLETVAPLSIQEKYDNAGMICGNAHWDCSGVITTLDATEEIVQEAIEKKCNLIVAHHPIVFGGLKSITGKNYVEKTIITAIKHDIAIYAIHTNLDNIITGVNGKIADLLGLVNRRVLSHASDTLKKLVTYVPIEQADTLRKALFAAGGGEIGNYSECSFTTEGDGTYRANADASPYLGKINELHTEREQKIEMIFPAWLQNKLLHTLKLSHPYEEVAFDVISLDNVRQDIGAGLVGDLSKPITEVEMLQMLQDVFKSPVIKHTRLLGKMVQKVAVCGGSGSFLTKSAISAGADFFVTGDVKYHEFFDTNDKLVLADIGHYESEQYTIDLLFDILREKFPTFAVLKTGQKTNPVFYFG